MDKKRIKIFTNGIIPVKGYYVGPVLTPFFETTERIFKLISAGIVVVEVLGDGTNIVLNAMNYDKNNEICVDDSHPQTVIDKHVTEESVSTKTEIMTETVVEETVNEEQLSVEDVKPTETVVEETVNEEQLPVEDVKPTETVVEETVNEEQLPVEDTEIADTTETVIKTEKTTTVETSKIQNSHINQKNNNYNKKKK